MRLDLVLPSTATQSAGRSLSLRIALERHRDAVCVAGDAVFDLLCQIQPSAVLFDIVDNAHALEIVLVAVGAEAVKGGLSGVSEGRVPEIVSECDGLGEILVQPQGARHCPRDLRDLKRMRQARSVVVADRGEKDLCLALEPPEGRAVQDAVSVPLKLCTQRTERLLAQSDGFVGAAGIRAEDHGLKAFGLFADGHSLPPSLVFCYIILQEPSKTLFFGAVFRIFQHPAQVFARKTVRFDACETDRAGSRFQ